MDGTKACVVISMCRGALKPCEYAEIRLLAPGNPSEGHWRQGAVITGAGARIDAESRHRALAVGAP